MPPRFSAAKKGTHPQVGICEARATESRSPRQKVEQPMVAHRLFVPLSSTSQNQLRPMLERVDGIRGRQAQERSSSLQNSAARWQAATRARHTKKDGRRSLAGRRNLPRTPECCWWLGITATVKLIRGLRGPGRRSACKICACAATQPNHESPRLRAAGIRRPKQAPILLSQALQESRAEHGADMRPTLEAYISDAT
jgi:hypothetical protein